MVKLQQIYFFFEMMHSILARYSFRNRDEAKKNFRGG
jgi:hypothetical protein